METYGEKVSWRNSANCIDTERGLFFSINMDDINVAKAICQACEVRDACLEYALAAREPEGIWGGYTERERRRMLKTNKRSA